MKSPWLLGFALSLAAQETALDRYVRTPDPVFAFSEVKSIPGAGYTAHVLELTSQTWRTEKDVDRPVWKHWLTIVRPEKVASNKGLLFIGGGRNGDPAPDKAAERSVRIALETNSVVADLGMVPNQPLRFTDSPGKARFEDDTIAYTRVKHFQTQDDTWLVRLAMVKSGVRAMDAIQQFLARQGIKVDQFVVSGGSKRGWTTWLVGVVDPRVIGIMPTVIDALNSEAITRHHFEAYGFFSSALNDYVNHGLFPHKIGTPEYRKVLEIEDAYEYRKRPSLARIPKLIMNASGDEFFLPDNSQFYFAAMPGEKNLRYVPNAKHNLQGSDAQDTLLAFYQMVIEGKARPRYSWKKEKDGSLVVKVTDKPSAVKLWQATNPQARDFRLDVIGKAYQSSELKPEKNGTYVGRVAKPAAGFTAFFVELTYPGTGKVPLKLTTEVSVTPDVLPFRWEDAAKKYPRAGASGGGK
jgi:PhoPQ-activated pathogenicity-related protein